MSANKQRVVWTPELTEQVRVWWEEMRLSAAEIAARIPGATKNCIIGKSHRMHWRHHRTGATGWFNGKRTRRAGTPPRPRRERPAKPPRSVTRALKPKPALPVPPPPLPRPTPPVEDPMRVEPGTVTLLALKPGMCKWPVNDPPRFGEYLFCGVSQVAERVYCEHHARIAYTGTRSRKDAAWVPRPRF
jgi:GcrA cell cycle regulator